MRRSWSTRTIPPRSVTSSSARASRMTRRAAGVYASYSSDGIHFTEAGRVLPMWPETSLIADWDPRIEKYVVFLRVFVRDHENQRRVGRFETDDLLKPWPYRPTNPAARSPSPENIPAVLSVDARDDPYSDLYTNAACIYPYAQDVYLMFPTPFRHFSPRRQPWFRFQPGNDYGLIEVQMAVSRDGIQWDRPDRRPYFPMGLPDEWDRWLTMMGVGIVRRGNSLYQYYWSTGRTHDSGILRPEYDKLLEPRGAIGTVRQPPGRIHFGRLCLHRGHPHNPAAGLHRHPPAAQHRHGRDGNRRSWSSAMPRAGPSRASPGATARRSAVISWIHRFAGEATAGSFRRFAGDQSFCTYRGTGRSSTPSSFPQARPLQKEC